MLTVLRVYHYAPRKTGLLARAVLPTLNELRREGGHQAAFVTRHWDGGSHLALHCGYGPLPADATGRVAERAAALGESGRTWSTEEYQSRRAEFERAEGRTARHPAPFPHGTVRVERESDPTPLDAVRHRLLTGLTDVLWNQVTLGGDARLGPGLVLQLMLAAGAVYPGGLRFGSLSYRSHAEAYLAASPDEPALRERFDGAYRQRAEALGRLVAGALADPASLAGHRAFTQAYARLTEPDLDTPVSTLLDAADRTTPTPQDGQVSAFHTVLREGGFHRRPPVGFLPFRVLVNWLYDILPVLDVSAADRYLYCYCIARAVDERLGEAWQDRLNMRPN
ncbi:hypothetical protein ABT072_28675 [Streptomyces sp. NPDC002589]|uniref:hypothetical protein n=1 Tax=Streptomyces sp. NPDC002589 TaxID=3154420 RepID=UPI003331F4F0